MTAIYFKCLICEKSIKLIKGDFKCEYCSQEYHKPHSKYYYSLEILLKGINFDNKLIGQEGWVSELIEGFTYGKS